MARQSRPKIDHSDSASPAGSTTLSQNVRFMVWTLGMPKPIFSYWFAMGST